MPHSTLSITVVEPVLTSGFKPTLGALLEPLGERELCTRCLRAKRVCYCPSLRPFTPSFTVVLLQHPKERKNTIGTARMTHLSLSNSLLIPGIGFEEDDRVNALIADPANHCVVLYPGENSVNVSEHADEFLTAVKSLSQKLVVFVIDGTWAQAKGMVRKSPRLTSLPQICFTPEIPSQYKVRKQPNRFCLSTIEAVHALIRVLDPKAPSDVLIDLFAGMVDRQIECGALRKVREVQHAVKKKKNA